jgi:hypothetical protein
MMTLQEMALLCVAALNETPPATGIPIVLKKGWKRPPKFPRGELLCETERGRVYSISPIKLLAWLAANGFVKVQAKQLNNVLDR